MQLWVCSEALARTFHLGRGRESFSGLIERCPVVASSKPYNETVAQKNKTKQKEMVNILLPIISPEKDFVIILVAVFAIHASAILMLSV